MICRGRDAKRLRDEFEAGLVLVRNQVETAKSDFFPRASGIVMLANKRGRKRVERGLSLSRPHAEAAALGKEVAYVETRHDEEVESVNRPLLDGEAHVVVGGKPALDLHSDLSSDLPRIGVNADEVIALVVRWSLVDKDVPAHEVTHNKGLRPQRDDREAGEGHL